MKKSNIYTISLCSALILLFSGCAKRPITSALFKQSSRPHIYLPSKKEERILAERVEYKTTVDTIRRANQALETDLNDGIKNHDLKEVTVVAERPKVKISTVRNGKINLSFLMQVPKAFMDERYQVVLRPKLLNGDKLIDMPPLVLQGSKFKEAQEKQYAKYADFEKAIIDPSKYDSVYFDQKRHDRFMTNLQSKYLSSYEADYNLQLRYNRWKRIMEERYLDHKARVSGAYDAKIADKALKAMAQAYDLDLYGEDSAQLLRRYDSLYTAERRTKTLEKKVRSIRLKDVPKSFRTLYQYNLTIDSLRNKSVTEQDSLNVAKHTYKHKAIAHNQSKRENKDTFLSHMVQLKRIEHPHLLDALTPGKDYSHIYSEDIDVTEDLQRKLRVFVETRVTAIDLSTWWQVSRDTLSFIVSGMNDMVDTKLIERLTPEQQNEYQQGLDRLAVRDYRGALEIFNRYPDYNAAVCLIALGYNKQAEKFLEYLTPSNGKTDYLKAIVQLRLGNKDKAKELLLSATRKEAQMAYRAEIDPEFTALFGEEPNLLKQLLEISHGGDEAEEV